MPPEARDLFRLLAEMVLACPLTPRCCEGCSLFSTNISRPGPHEARPNQLHKRLRAASERQSLWEQRRSSYDWHWPVLRLDCYLKSWSAKLSDIENAWSQRPRCRKHDQSTWFLNAAITHDVGLGMGPTCFKLEPKCPLESILDQI